MDNIFSSINFWSALCGFTGSVMLFFYGLPPAIHKDGHSYLLLEQDDKQEAKKYKRFKILSYLALGLVAVSFLLQIISLVTGVTNITLKSVNSNVKFYENNVSKCNEDDLQVLKTKITAYSNNFYNIPESIINDSCSPQKLKDIYQVFKENQEMVEEYRKNRGYKPNDVSESEWVKEWDEWYQKNSSPQQASYIDAVKNFLGISK